MQTSIRRHHTPPGYLTIIKKLRYVYFKEVTKNIRFVEKLNGRKNLEVIRFCYLLNMQTVGFVCTGWRKFSMA